MYSTLSRCQVVAPVAVHDKSRCSLSTSVAPTRKPVFRSKSNCLQRRDTTIVRAEAETYSTAVTEDNFQKEVLDSALPVIVDFWAPWCGPCRMIAPLIDELAVEYSGKLKAVKLNTDEAPGIATKYGIRSIPTVMVFKDGKKVDCIIGAVPKSTLTNTIEKYVD